MHLSEIFNTARNMMLKTMVLAGVICLSGMSAARAEEPYLFERLDRPEFRQTFERLFAGEENLEAWLARYIKVGDGVDFPGEIRTVQGAQYYAHQVCRPHDCPGNGLYVLFSPDGSRAWALLTVNDGSSRFFGHPDAGMQQVLQEVANPRSE